MASTASTASKRMKKNGRKNDDIAKKSSNMLSLIILLPIAIALIIIMKAGFILILCGIMPSIVAYYANTEQQKFSVYTIGCCNISGVLPLVMELHDAHNTWPQLSGTMADPMTWLQMYGMAGVGYALIKGCPMLYHWGLRIINSSLAFQLEMKQEALVKEWGEDIRNDANATRSNALTII